MSSLKFSDPYRLANRLYTYIIPVTLRAGDFFTVFRITILNIRTLIRTIVIILLAALSSACSSLDDERIPAMPVNINLADAGLWNTYGVAGFGIYRQFIPSLGLPSGFRYSATTATGYGGVLLIGGMDPFTGDTNVPLAYDLACPVERKPDIRVKVDPDNFEAICPVCGSHFDVTMQGGAPLSGPAATDNPKCGMTRYRCIPSSGGYTITR